MPVIIVRRFPVQILKGGHRLLHVWHLRVLPVSVWVLVLSPTAQCHVFGGLVNW